MLPKKTSFCLPIFLSIFFHGSLGASAKLPEFETAWLESTGGAGVGSILMDESTMLNPAPLAFFNTSSLYFQKSGVDVNTPTDTPFKTESSSQLALIASDATGFGGGSVSYIKTRRGAERRKQFGFAFGYPTGKVSSMGIGHRIVRGQKRYSQTTIGLAHAIDPSFTLGFVLIGPFRRKEEGSRAFLGFQYVYKNFVTLLFDTGTNYTSEFSNSMVYRSALQIRLLNDLLLRAGAFRDKGLKERGNGIGLGWVQPRLVLNFGLKNSRSEMPEGQKTKQSSFSVSYKF